VKALVALLLVDRKARDKDVLTGQLQSVLKRSLLLRVIHALRRLYVKAPYRGQQRAIAPQLLERLVQSAKDAEARDIYLATTEKFVAALRFYEKNGFIRVDQSLIPGTFPRIPQETLFFHRRHG
jgi:GNAT superfamily N-acetyltransferase